jgi:Amt family ammonium transporter
VDCNGAIIMGFITGIFCAQTIRLKHFFGYDDALDTFGVHAIGGMLGAILTGVFADPNINGSCSTTIDKVTGCFGLLYGNPGQVLIQLEGIAATIVWTSIGTAVILYAIKFTIGLRVTPEQETEGLDLALHGEQVH